MRGKRIFPLSLLLLMPVAVWWLLPNELIREMRDYGFALFANAAFLSLIYEVRRSDLHRYWLVAPAVWFGGYWLLVICQRIDIANIDYAVRTANAQVRVPFDPEADRLVFEQEFLALDKLVPTKLAVTYGVPLLYVRSLSRTTAFRFAGKQACTKIQYDPRAAAADIGWAPISVEMFENGATYLQSPPGGVCRYWMREEPSEPILLVSRSSERVRGWLTDWLRLRANLARRGKAHSLQVARVQALHWYPHLTRKMNPDALVPYSYFGFATYAVTVGLDDQGESYDQFEQALIAALGLKPVPIEALGQLIDEGADQRVEARMQVSPSGSAK